MSFKIGQWRQDQSGGIESYQIDIEEKLGIQEGFIWIEEDVLREGGLKYEFKEGITYCLTFSLSFDQRAGAYVKLLDESKTKEMTIQKIELSNTSSYQIIFTPNRNYNFFIVEVIRNTSNLKDKDLYCKLIIKDFYELKNLLINGNFTNNYPELKSIKKLGIQGPEGLIFGINGESFQMGKSEIYTVSDIEIKSLCFYLKKKTNYLYPYQNDFQFFIMDFEY